MPVSTTLKRICVSIFCAVRLTAALIRVTQPIIEQIQEYLPDAGGIDKNRRQVGRQVNREGNAFLLERAGQHIPDICHDLVNLGLFPVERHLPGIHFAHIQDIVDQPQKMPAGGIDLLDILI